MSRDQQNASQQSVLDERQDNAPCLTSFAPLQDASRGRTASISRSVASSFSCSQAESTPAHTQVVCPEWVIPYGDDVPLRFAAGMISQVVRQFLARKKLQNLYPRRLFSKLLKSDFYLLYFLQGVRKDE